jgi:hypothetical protein
MRKQLSLLIICLILFSSVATAFHHHDDAADHGDCPICVVSHHQQATGSSPVAISISRSYTIVTWSLPAVTILTAAAYTPANNRAPPA